MALNNKEDIYKMALQVVEEENIFNICDIMPYLPIQKSTFYLYFPENSEELDNIKEKINHNRIKTKQILKKKWFDSENPTLQIALMRLICTPEEHRQLNQNYTENTIKTDNQSIVDKLFPSEDEICQD